LMKKVPWGGIVHFCWRCGGWVHYVRRVVWFVICRY
jgi:hypothetical protein